MKLVEVGEEYQRTQKAVPLIPTQGVEATKSILECRAYASEFIFSR